MSSRKRAIHDSPPQRKRLKMTSPDGAAVAVDVAVDVVQENAPKTAPETVTTENLEKSKRNRIRKLTASRPFPTVPTSVSATGPRSAHTEGKNMICITRKTSLGAYLRRCKNVFIKDGYKTLHLSAMGAAIPLLLQLAVALPPILPFSPQEIHTETTTGTVEVVDEVLPEDEDEDITQQTRGKSTLQVIIRVDDGEPSVSVARNSRKKVKPRAIAGHAQDKASPASNAEVVVQEPEQVEMEMV